MSTPRHFLTLEDFTEDQLRGMLAMATELKARTKRGERSELLPHKMLAMIFEKQSTRTRVSFDVGMRQLGGETMFLTGDSMQLAREETLADTARVMKTLLKGMGHHVVWATGARRALEAVGRESFDLMISDLGLPDGSGWDLMRRVKQFCPDIRGIALSGYGMENDLRRSKEAGFEEHVVKPFNFARLTELIHKVTDEEEGG